MKLPTPRSVCRCSRWFFLAALLCVSGPLCAADGSLPEKAPAELGFDAKRLERVPAMLRREIEAGHFAGAAWLIARDGAIASHGVAGLRDVATGAPMTGDTVFRIFSMSKIVTSVALLTLVEEGRVNLDDPVERYLPELANRQVLVGGTADAPQLEPAKRPITLRHLLTHTSGLVYDIFEQDPIKTIWGRAEMWKSASLREAISRLAPLPLAHQPGARWTYGVNTDVLGAVIEGVTGQTLEVAMRERVFAPLGMTDTTFRLTDAQRARLATIHHPDAAGVLRKDEQWTQLGTLDFPSGGGGLFSTLHDYARFAQMLLNEGQLDGVRVLGRKTVELMLSDQLVQLGDAAGSRAPRHMGLGVALRREDRQAPAALGSPGSYGWSGAASTDVIIDPTERLVLIVLLQHVPFNPQGIFQRFANTVYQSLE